MKKATKYNNYHYNKRLQPLAKANKKNMTKSAACMWKYVLGDKQMKGYQFRRERPILDYIADFVCLELMLIVEVDGLSHDSVEALRKDEIRDKRLTDIGFAVLRFNSWEVLNRMADVSIIMGDWIDQNTTVVPKGRRKRKKRKDSISETGRKSPPPAPSKGEKI